MNDSYEDDDTHFCLKCHATIVGLDNYVNHRKLLCNKNASTLLSPDDPFSLKADDFFSSLELQSSSKKVSSAPTNTKTGGIFTRSKTLAALHGSTATNKDLPTQNQQKALENTWLEESSSTFKDGDTKTKKRVEESKEADSEKSEQESVEFMSDNDESEEEEEEDDVDDDGNVPPKSFTGGKWKPNSPIQWYGMQNQTDEREWNPPPPTHTGGKWKPVNYYQFPPTKEIETKCSNLSVPPATHTKGKWKPPPLSKKEYSEIKSSSQKYEAPAPPPLHTKGKYKSPVQIKSSAAPPPSHTRGKWKPRDREELNVSTNRKIDGRPFIKSNGRIQYWCGPCNRRLSSKIIYNRHLKSELHLKRTNDGDFEYLPRLKEKQKIPKSEKLATGNGPKKDVVVRKQRKRKRLYKKCDVCNSRVNMKTIGKHLISHYHCRRRNLMATETHQLVLDNIHKIVLQCPFQCSLCMFYCNTQETFLQHWTSSMHKDEDFSKAGYFNCSFCKFNCIDSEEMYKHLTSEDHSEVISVINGSVPIVIKWLKPIKCAVCNEEFLLNIQLRKHCERVGHSLDNTASDAYQNKHKCSLCDVVLKSVIALQRHMLFAHKTSTFVCGICGMNFTNAEEVKNHRKSLEHRGKMLEKRQNQAKNENAPRKCNFCSKIFHNFFELKKHQKDEHPEIKHSCPYCGKSFTISQDLTVHIRTRACSFTDPEEKEHTCGQCPFKTNSMSDILFHNALHTEPLVLYPEEVDPNQSPKKPIEQYKCPICEKFFPKSSLLCHLRLHTSERPYCCKVCNANFARKNNLLYHMKKHERKQDMAPKEDNKNQEGEAPRLHLCSTCGASFRKRFILQQHMTRHTGKLFRCPKPDCVFSARSPGELKPHLLTHQEEKPFSCQQCDYRGKTKQQLLRHLTRHDSQKKHHCPQCSFSTRFASHLRRHLRLHTGAKPYACPHCDHRCNTLENLRKHVLSTLKHPGKFIYECKLCKNDVFRTNFAKDFKVHLINEHPDKFLSGNEATSYIAGIYEAGNDTPSSQIVLDSFKEQNSVVKEILEKPEETSTLQEVTASTSQTVRNNDVGPAILLTSVSVQDANEHKIQDELFPMFIVSKDVVRIENLSESWIMEENYDVEEAGVLIPFQTEEDSLFHEHF